jgi:hypothetical protein
MHCTQFCRQRCSNTRSAQTHTHAMPRTRDLRLLLRELRDETRVERVIGFACARRRLCNHLRARSVSETCARTRHTSTYRSQCVDFSARRCACTHRCLCLQLRPQTVSTWHIRGGAVLVRDWRARASLCAHLPTPTDDTHTHTHIHMLVA